MTERPALRTATPRRYLMCPPTYFDVSYSINPWMNPDKPVDRERAVAQWETLRDLYVRLGRSPRRVRNRCAPEFSIFRTACNTVVWSRPPKRRPISGNDRSVNSFARYIATCLGRTTLAVRLDDKRSARLTLYCLATTR